MCQGGVIADSAYLMKQHNIHQIHCGLTVQGNHHHHLIKILLVQPVIQESLKIPKG